MKHPLISFCIATYRRPKFIKSTIKSILLQNYPNLEVVISEDPSDINSEKVIKSFRSKKIKYHKNKTHLGMTKSYNKAIDLAKGDFIVLLADDDPPTPKMSDIFLNAYSKYPKAKAFWGGSYANITTDKIKKITHLERGYNSLINRDKKKGLIEIINSVDFYRQFFNQQIFPHYQWTTAIIAKDIIKKINGVPDYNSAHFIDYAYLLRIAKDNKFVIINDELGSFALHEGSYGKKKDTLEEYKKGVAGFNEIIYPLANKFKLTKEYHQFLTNFVIMFLIGRFEFYKIHKLDINTNDLFMVYKDISKTIPFFKDREKEIYFKLKFYSLYMLINKSREIYGNFKSKLLNKK